MTKLFTALLAGVAVSAALSGPGYAQGKVIGVSWADLGNEGRKVEDTAIRTAVEAAGNSYTSADGRSSDAKQASDIEGLVAQGVDAIIIVAEDATTVAPAVEKAIAAGIPVLGYDRPVEHPKAFYVGFDEKQVGRMQTRAALELKPEGNYAFVKGPSGDADADALFAGQIEVFQQALGSGSIRSVSEVFTDGWDIAAAQRNMQQVLIANDNQVDVVIASDDAIAAGVVSALDRQGLAGVVTVVGQGATADALKRIALGTQAVTVWKDARELGYAAGDIASELAAGKPPADIAGAVDFTTAAGNPVKSIFPPPVAITRDNLDLVIDAGLASKEAVCADVAAGTVPACG